MESSGRKWDLRNLEERMKYAGSPETIFFFANLILVTAIVKKKKKKQHSEMSLHGMVQLRFW